jgi:Lysophospholipase L1 and related esterases
VIKRWMKIGKVALLAAAIVAVQTATANANESGGPVWVPAYLSSPSNPIVDVPPEVIPPPQEIQGTVRYKLTLWAEGERLALRLSNEAGKKPLRIDHVTVALDAGTTQKFVDVTFGGSRSVVMPAGAPAVSDPVSLAVKPGSELLVSLYLPEPYTHAQSDSVRPVEYSPAADETASQSPPNAQTLFVRPIVSAVLALTESPRQKVIVAFGDSITDGYGMKSVNFRGWPELLAGRFVKEPTSRAVVVNAGISGNRLLADGWGISALARFDRDVLSFPSVTHVILLEGINDIGMARSPDAIPPTSQDLAGAYRQLIARAHQRGIDVVCGTLLPFGDSFYFTEQTEQLRQQANAWLRSSGECDALIDFDEAMRDPARPRRLRAEYDSGDQLHPNDAGYRAMADLIDLKLFR